jgi:hypothetical protein
MVYTSVYVFASTGWNFIGHFSLVLGIPGEPIVVTSEEDIFEYIGYPYKKPSERD